MATAFIHSMNFPSTSVARQESFSQFFQKNSHHLGYKTKCPQGPCHIAPIFAHGLPAPFFVFLCFAWISNPDLYLISLGRPFVMERGGFLTWVCVLAVPDPISEFSDDGPVDEGTLDVRENLCKASSAFLFLISSSSLFRAFPCFSATLTV